MSYSTLATFSVVVVTVASMLVCLSRSRRFAAAMESVSFGIEFKVTNDVCYLIDHTLMTTKLSF